MKTLVWKSLRRAAWMSGWACALGAGCAVDDRAGVEEDDQKQCVGDERADHATTIDEACHGPPYDPLLAEAQGVLCTLLSGTGPLTAADAKAFVDAVSKAAWVNQAFREFIDDAKPMPASLAALIERNRKAWLLLSEGRRALALDKQRATPELDAALPIEDAMVTAVLRKVVPDNARVSNEAFQQEHLVNYHGPEQLRDPSQWLPWLDADHDGWVTGAEYNGWGARWIVDWDKEVGVSLPHKTLSQMGLHKTVMPLGFKTIEEALLCKKKTVAAPHPWLEPVTGTALRVVQNMPEAVVDGVAYFRVVRPFPGGSSSAVSLDGGAPMPQTGGVAVDFSEYQPLNFSYFAIDGAVYFLDGSGVHGWDAAAGKWVTVIARDASLDPPVYGANVPAVDNGGFVAGRRVFQFRQVGVLADKYYLALEYYDFDDRKHHRIAGSLAPADTPKTNAVVIGTTAYVQIDHEDRIRALDTTTFTWTVLPAGPMPQYYSVLAARKGKLLRLGGGTTRLVDGQLMLYPIRNIFAYDPKTGSWSAGGDTQRIMTNWSAKSYPQGDAALIAGRLPRRDPEVRPPVFAYRVK